MRNHFRNFPLHNSLDKVIAALQAYQSAPNPNTSAAFKLALSEFDESAKVFPPEFSNKSYQQVLEDVHGKEFLGPHLSEAVRTLIAEHSLTPVDLQANLQEFRKGLGEFIDRIVLIAETLDVLEIEYEQLDGGEFEIGLHLPKDLVGNYLSDLNKEIVHFDRLFSALNELMGRGNESVIVRTVSTTWYQFFLQLDVTQIAAITFAIERIVALYKNNLEIRKLKRDTELHKNMEDVAKLIEQKIEDKLRQGMADIASQVRKEYQKNENDERVNEVEIQIK
ncbi:MAG: hypothetical protein ABL860_03295, partial [Candidatus Nitrotoga sp.]